MIRIAALFGFLAVALGAFGAHGLQRVLEQHQSVEIWKTAVLYHLAHSVVLLVLSCWNAGRRPFYFFAGGIVLFSGSLYALALTGIKWLGAITPLGGLLLLVGWAYLILLGANADKIAERPPR
ncbi:MAG: DUF423 domain-containing protein [Methylacidiphilales bacterium]|nr:DUF423 domain-containing protein [Candidatus Methylacidiphilales bacterium]